MAKNCNVMAPRFYATSWAFPYLKDYPRAAENTFAELLCGSSVDLALIDKLIKECKDELEDSELSDPVRNWNCSIHDLFLDTQVWFVTSQEIGSEVSVYNRFTGKDEIVRVPSVPSNIIVITTEEECPSVDRDYHEELDKKPIHSEENSVDEEIEIKEYIWLTNPDLLGVYLQKTGTIFIFIDRIDEYKDKHSIFKDSQFIFQVILLHEFIHAVLDLVPDSKRNSGISKGEWSTSLNGEYIDEESVDNAIALSAYNHDSKAKDFIASQPEEYRNALEIKDEETLKDFIISLIKYKLDGKNDNISNPILNPNEAPSNQDQESESTGKSESYSITANGDTDTGVIRSHVIEYVVRALIKSNPNITAQDLRNIFGTSVIKLPGEKIPDNSIKCELPNGDKIVLNFNVWYKGDVKKKIIDKLWANGIYNISIY